MIKFLLLFWILLKATVTSFAGLASLPEVRRELVVERQMLTDEDLNKSVVITRTTPGPVGSYVVAVGYMADGVPGAIAGWLAMVTPSMLVILLVGYFGRRAEHPRVRGLLQCVVMASATLLVLASVPIGRDAIRGPLALAIAVVAFALLVSKNVDTVKIVGGAAALSLLGSAIGIAQIEFAS